MTEKKNSLLTRDFILICLAQLCGSMSSYCIMQVMPLYILDEYHCSKSILGITLAVYSLAALFARPFSGWASDRFPRKILFLLTTILMALFCPVYLLLPTVLLFGLLRIAHGLVFSFMTTSMNTLAIDIIPRQKLGTGLGIFSSLLSLAMIFGPMTGLFIYEHFGYDTAFIATCVISACGFFTVLPIPKGMHASGKNTKFSVSGMFFREGLSTCLVLFFGIFLYGLCLNYISVYAREHGLSEWAGTFFLVMGTGLFVSRIFAGWLADHGFLVIQISAAIIGLAAAGIIFSCAGNSLFLFLLVAFLGGIATGIIQPSCQTLLVLFGGPERSGAANSLFFIGLDGGIVLSVLSGGFIADFVGLDRTFLFGGLLQAAALFTFLKFVVPQYKKFTSQEH